jgi:NitT/TauT family transport system ATP-binding protein
MISPSASASAPESAAPAAVSLAGVSKSYGPPGGAVAALDGIDLDIAENEFVCIVGASGCGKSTLLSILGGLEPPTSGSVAVGSDRPALMFQEPALLPWLTVARNVELPLRLRGMDRASRAQTVSELLHLVSLEAFARKRPHELSGGMRQRVALARALAQRSRVLLMDEPFAALDAITRDVLHEELTRIWRQTKTTIVFVTHNVREAVRLGDRVVLLSSRPGRVLMEWAVDIPRPRTIETPPVGALATHIVEQLRTEIRHHGGA